MLYLRLADHLRASCLALAPHSKMPSVRALAKEHQVNPSTVVAALKLLESEKVLYCRQGSGTYRAPHATLPLEHFEELRSAIDFTSGTPSPEYFPVADFKEAFNTVLDRDGGQAFAYPDPQGYSPLRQSIAKYLSSQGMNLAADNIHITSGAQQAIFLLGQLLLSPGDYVLMECPSYSGALQVFAAAGAKIIGVPLGYQGLRPKELVQAQKHSPRLIYTIPNFHNPTGLSYSQDARQTLIDYARRHNYYIIEDDHITELYYTGTRPRSLWQDAPDRVLYIKSFSKIFMPGLRLGFLVVPRELSAALNKAKQTVDLGSSGITQRALQLYLESNKWLQHLDTLRSVYGERASGLYAALKNHLKGEAVFHPLRGGMNSWVGLPADTHVPSLLKSAAEQGVSFTPGEQFNLPPYDYKNYLRLSIAATSLEQIDAGIAIIAASLARQCHQ
ncbi:MAG: PLP-dependent aminotransferase family protein [Peptococcaceae bacterium]|nr:PLP-dependent aminotransferase family protein [Peptococcaceae bacterium]